MTHASNILKEEFARFFIDKFRKFSCNVQLHINNIYCVFSSESVLKARHFDDELSLGADGKYTHAHEEGK